MELYRHFGYFALGAISCLLFTEIAKYTIGRLRPHFLTICNPEFTSQLCQVSRVESSLQTEYRLSSFHFNTKIIFTDTLIKDGSAMNYEKFVVENENIICRGKIIF